MTRQGTPMTTREDESRPSGDKAMNEKLKPCPFCGGRAERPTPSAPHGGMAQCSSCGASAFGPKWNRRAPSPAASTVLDLEEVHKAVFGDIGDEPNVFADYDRCSELSGKMRWAIATLSALTSPQGQETPAAPARQVDVVRKRVMRAIFDPGATEGFKGERDLTTWQTDAVMRALAATEGFADA